MKKINFKQPKYIFPLIILLPVVFLAYCVSDLFGDSGGKDVSHVGLQTELPDANTSGLQDKYSSMYNQYALDEDAYTAISGIELDQVEADTLRSAYTDDEKARMDAEALARKEQEESLRALQENLAQSRRQISSPSGTGRHEIISGGQGYGNEHEEERAMAEYAAQIQAMQMAQKERQKMLAKALGLEEEEKEAPAVTEPIEKPEPPMLVIKSRDANADRFNTIGDVAGDAEASLIRAMIDKTTKAHQGTRLRFKLLDDITIKDVHLNKGTYLYGTVTGFGQQRVKAAITSILVGGRFIKVDLSVYDNDGMEGFYVPESAFRDFMKSAGAGVAQQNININSGYGSEITGESLALQALQSVYNSASQAVAANIRKNRAKIKYNTIVYLVNSRDAE